MDHASCQLLVSLDQIAPDWTTAGPRLRRGALQHTTSLHYVRRVVGRLVPEEPVGVLMPDDDEDAAAVQAPRPGDGTPDIRLVSLEKRFGDVAAVDDVDLDVSHGEFFTMLGPSGSG